LLAQPAPAKAGVVSFLNVLEIRLRSILLAASLSFDRMRNQRARDKNKTFYPAGK
jgi:hypothetical protein